MAKIVAAWDQNMKPYYHFTSFDAFCEIYRTKKIRLSPCNLVKNAAVETMALYSELERIFNFDICLQGSLLKLFNKENRCDLVNFLIEDRNKSYISCFSSFDENNEINAINDARYMWKFYANDVNGVVIKFNFKCFQYMNHNTTEEQDVDGSFHRVTEIRMDKVIYDTDKLKKGLSNCESSKMKMHTFATDVYKPKFCELEQEIRFLVYVADRAQLDCVI